MYANYSSHMAGNPDFTPAPRRGGAPFPGLSHFLARPAEPKLRAGALSASKVATLNDAVFAAPRGHGSAHGLRRAGRTPLDLNPWTSDYFGLQHLTIKDESRNPFGTHKDRKSPCVVRNSRRLCAKWTPRRGHVRRLTGHLSPHRLLCLQGDASLMETFRAVRRILPREPPSAAAFEGMRRAALSKDGRVVVINTGTFRPRAVT